MLILTLAEKGGESKDLTFDKTEIRVGRVRDNDIVLPKGNVSKHHCRLLLQNGQLLVEDLGSTMSLSRTLPTRISVLSKLRSLESPPFSASVRISMASR